MKVSMGGIVPDNLILARYMAYASDEITQKSLEATNGLIKPDQC